MNTILILMFHMIFCNHSYSSNHGRENVFPADFLFKLIFLYFGSLFIL